MKYRCSHCNHHFELEAKDFLRCPNCFWTTSLVPIEEGANPRESHQTEPEPSKSIATRKPPRAAIIFLSVAIGGAGLIGVSYLVSKTPAKIAVPFPKVPGLPSTTSSEPGAFGNGAASLLTQEERALLKRSFQVKLPRELTESEQGILKKQVALPASITQKPSISLWSKEDFESLLEEEQRNRKISLGWLYKRELRKTFEKNYLPAGEAFDSGNYELAREGFIRSLSLPIYRNDPKRYRAVVLVMLRPYVNDVIGKIAVLSQFLLTQSVSDEIQSIFDSYQELFALLESRDWPRALEQIERIKERIGSFENRPKEDLIQYPASFGDIDTELQNAIRTEAAPKPEAVMHWKAVLIDLGLKEKVAKENLPEALTEAQKRFDEAMQLLTESEWEAARSKLRAIDYPPELVLEAKEKLALIGKILALQESKGKS